MTGLRALIRWLHSSFKASAALAIGLTLILATNGAVSLYTGSKLVSQLRQDVTDRNRLLAATLANDIDTFLQGHILTLSLLDKPGYRNQAGVDGIKRAYPAFKQVLVADGSGRVEYATEDATGRNFDISKRDFFIEAKRTGQPYLSATFIAEGDFSPTAVLAVADPSGVAIGYLNLAELGRYIAGLPLAAKASIAVVDRNGVLVAHDDARQVLERGGVALEDWFRASVGRGSGSVAALRPNGETELVSWAPMRSPSDWTVIVSESLKSVFRLADQFAALTLIGVLGVSVVSILFIFGVILFLDKDLRALRAYSRAVAEGRYDTAFEFRGFKDLAPLAADYAAAAAAVREREERIQDNEHRLLRILDFMPVPAVLLDRNSSIVLINKSMTNTYGWTKDDISTIGEWWTTIYPDADYRETVKSVWDDYLKLLETGSEPPERFEGRLACKDGAEKLVLGDAAIISDRIIVIFIDVTAARAAEARMSVNLQEKEVLLKEIHHRVKNNLQLIVSLLALESAGTENKSFSDSIDRIRVMATIHELLYESKDIAHIDLGDFIRTIVDWIGSSYTTNTTSPRIDLDLAPIELDIDSAVSCGLIINELFTNSIKYAFDATIDEPQVAVRAIRDADGTIELTVSDNGKGIPADIDPSKVTSLGMQLIVSLTDQLHGKWELSRADGTTWRIRFKPEE